MGSDFSIKPVGAPAGATFAPPLRVPAEDSVATELPARQSVTAADTTARTRLDPSNTYDPLSHQAFLDRDAGSVVYQVIDSRTNMVVDQFPDDAMLRRRAYFRALDTLRTDRGAAKNTDRKA